MNVTFWEGKTVFVTGAGGFIGSHLTESLVKYGAHVRAMVRYNSSNQWGFLDTLSPEISSEIQVIPGDVRDQDSVRKLAEGCSHGFHLAALISIPYSYEAPQSYVDTNITGTLNVLRACQQSPHLEQVVVTSTSEVYGTAQYVPIDENHPMQGQSPYSATKISADHIAESFYRSFDLPVCILRPFNTYGPRQSMRAVIPNIIRQGLAGDRVFLGNLKPTRDFNYVLDTVYGFLLAGSNPAAIGQVINIGRGDEISIEDLVCLIETLLERKLDIQVVEERHRPEKSEVYRLVCSIDKAKSLLRYQPQFTLKQGLAETIQWMTQSSFQTHKVAVYHV